MKNVPARSLRAVVEYARHSARSNIESNTRLGPLHEMEDGPQFLSEATKIVRRDAKAGNTPGYMLKDSRKALAVYREATALLAG